MWRGVLGEEDDEGARALKAAGLHERLLAFGGDHSLYLSHSNTKHFKTIQKKTGLFIVPVNANKNTDLFKERFGPSLTHIGFKTIPHKHRRKGVPKRALYMLPKPHTISLITFKPHVAAKPTSCAIDPSLLTTTF